MAKALEVDASPFLRGLDGKSLGVFVNCSRAGRHQPCSRCNEAGLFSNRATPKASMRDQRQLQAGQQV